VFNSREIDEKIKKTNLERYGVDNVFKSKELKERYQERYLKEHGVKYYQDLKDGAF